MTTDDPTPCPGCEEKAREVADRRLRASLAIGILRAEFKLRVDCCRVEDAAVDAVNEAESLRAEMARERLRFEQRLARIAEIAAEDGVEHAELLLRIHALAAGEEAGGE